jgi:hypothetical protein
MKTALKFAAGVGALSALSGIASTANAQNSASATATGTATIVQAIAVSKTADLGFGTIVKPTTGTSTISVSATGNTRTVSGGNATFANGNGVSSAAFTVTGEGGAAFSINVPASFNMTAGTNTLVVTTSNPTGGTGTLGGSAGSAGSLVLGVGGSFPLATNTASGAYSGTFQVTVAYN